MGSKANYLEDKLNDHVLGAVTYTPPASVYLALFTANPTDAGGGTEVGTGTWTNYARLAVTNNTTNWPSSASGVKSNGVAFNFPASTQTGDVVVTGMAVMDASSGGNFLYWTALTASKTMQNGDVFQFGIGTITVTED